MKIFVTGVAGQLGHDVMNELNKRGYEGVGSDLAPVLQRNSGWHCCHHNALCFCGYYRCRRCGKSHHGSRRRRCGTLCSLDSCRCSRR